MIGENWHESRMTEIEETALFDFDVYTARMNKEQRGFCEKLHEYIMLQRLVIEQLSEETAPVVPLQPVPKYY